MDAHCSWVAVRDGTAETLVAAMGMVDTGARAASNSSITAGLWAAERQGWAVVCASGGDFVDDIQEKDAQRLSDPDGEAIFWWADDIMMCSYIKVFAGGATRWSLIYNGSDGVARPLLRGEAPDLAREVVAAQTARQEADTSGADYIFEIAHILGQRLVGFRHEAALAEGAEPYWRLSQPGEQPAGVDPEAQ